MRKYQEAQIPSRNLFRWHIIKKIHKITKYTQPTPFQGSLQMVVNAVVGNK